MGMEPIGIAKGSPFVQLAFVIGARVATANPLSGILDKSKAGSTKVSFGDISCRLRWPAPPQGQAA